MRVVSCHLWVSFFPMAWIWTLVAAHLALTCSQDQAEICGKDNNSSRMSRTVQRALTYLSYLLVRQGVLSETLKLKLVALKNGACFIICHGICNRVARCRQCFICGKWVAAWKISHPNKGTKDFETCQGWK